MEITCQLERKRIPQNLSVYLLHSQWKKSLTYNIFHGGINDRAAYPNPRPTHLKHKENQDRCFGTIGTDVIFLKNFTTIPGCMTLVSHCIKMLNSHKINYQNIADGKLLVSTIRVGSQHGWRATLLHSAHVSIKDDRPVPFLRAFSKDLNAIMSSCYSGPSCQRHAVQVSGKKLTERVTQTVCWKALSVFASLTFPLADRQKVWGYILRLAEFLTAITDCLL